jgi:hypothetical protein
MGRTGVRLHGIAPGTIRQFPSASFPNT